MGYEPDFGAKYFTINQKQLLLCVASDKYLSNGLLVTDFCIEDCVMPLTTLAMRGRRYNYILS